jgi:hypothetical protein
MQALTLPDIYLLIGEQKKALQPEKHMKRLFCRFKLSNTTNEYLRLLYETFGEGDFLHK